MIISHKYRFIFIKTRKTAGTTVEAFLSKFCGDGDIFSTVTPPEPDHTPRNWQGLFNPLGELQGLNWKSPENKVVWEDFRHRKKYYNHLEAWRIKNRVGSKIFNTYFKFCFDRNPWDKAVSHYWFENAHKPESVRPSFEAFINERRVYVDFPLYSIKGKVVMDFIGQYHRLEDDLAKVMDLIGIAHSTPLDLPRAKGNYRLDKRHYSHYYNDQTCELIRELYAREIALFGYTFEQEKI